MHNTPMAVSKKRALDRFMNGILINQIDRKTPPVNGFEVLYRRGHNWGKTGRGFFSGLAQAKALENKNNIIHILLIHIKNNIM